MECTKCSLNSFTINAMLLSFQKTAEIIKSELTKRFHRLFPITDIRVKTMQANILNTDASKSDKEKLNRILEEMFEEVDRWLLIDN